MNKSLTELKNYQSPKGPVLTIVMDGVAIAPDCEGNAVCRANTPNLDMLLEKYPTLKLRAHGTAVGLPSDDDMGNSEVGHNALGSGQVFSQGAKLVSKSIEEGSIYSSDTWRSVVDTCVSNGSTLHFLGLFSDGNVHSNISHLKGLIIQAKSEGIARVRVHILLDGRDVGETSALEYVEPFEAFLSDLRDDSFDIKIASGGGRMKITMDRYQADWSMVERGWQTHVLGIGRQFASAKEAIETYRQETGAIDQDLDPFVIAENGSPVGTIEDNDSVIFFNFRGDRSIEISLAFDEDNFDHFDRVRRPRVFYAGMLEYDGDLHIPKHYLVNPPNITNTMGEYLADMKIAQYAISETQKYGHVTYFWNGNKSGYFDPEYETYVEIKSDVVPFEERPCMKCREITDELLSAIRSGKYRYLRVNFPNGDMVGHTGCIDATITSLEAMDVQLGRILAAVDEAGGVALITADHGNADEMYELDKKGALKTDKNGNYKSKTSHTLNRVPLIIYDNRENKGYSVKSDDGRFGLSAVAATTVNLLGYAAPDMWDESVINI